jgi:hypothetical protein
MSFVQNLVELSESFKFSPEAEQKVHKFLITAINEAA